MAVNWTLLQNQLDLVFTKKKPNSENEAAKKIADAYESAIITASTVLQNTVISYNKPILQTNLSTAFLLARSTSKFNVKLIASGFIGFWTGAMFNPLPPNPPTIAPSPILPPCIVTFPGDIVSLENSLKTAFITFNGKTSKLCIDSLVLALQSHLLTVSGIYNGMIPSPAGPVPSPPIPWLGVI